MAYIHIPDYVRDKVDEVRQQFNSRKSYLNKIMRVAGELSWNEGSITHVVDKLYPEYEKVNKQGTATKKRLTAIARSLSQKLEELDYKFPPREQISPLEMWFSDKENGYQCLVSKQTDDQPLTLAPNKKSEEAAQTRVSSENRRHMIDVVLPEGTIQGITCITPNRKSKKAAQPPVFSEKWPLDKILGEVIIEGTPVSAPNKESEAAQMISFENQKYNDLNLTHVFDRALPEVIIEGIPNATVSKPQHRNEFVLLYICLSQSEESEVRRFATLYSSLLTKIWRENVTHVVISSNATFPIRRKHEIMLAILHGKWVVSTQWVKNSLEENHILPEETCELNHDDSGPFKGPTRGRNRANKQMPNLFAGLGFYMSRYLSPLCKQSIEELVLVGGGQVLNEFELSSPCTKYIVYNDDPPQNTSSENWAESIDERSEEVLDFAWKNGSSHHIPYPKIFDAISSFETRIFDVPLAEMIVLD